MGDPAVPETSNILEISTRPLRAVSPAPKSEPKTERTPLALQTVVPGTRYRITGWLGEGGMGTVFEAKDEALRRRVALKVINTRSALGSEAEELLRREAQVVSGLGSPRIVEVFDLLTLPDGRVAIVMELLRGDSMAAIKEPIAPDRAIGMLRQIAHALRDAHGAGIIHRDIKPRNIFVLDGKEPDAIKLLDFGIAQLEGDDEPSGWGTPAYMAPEQIRDECSVQSDIYSVGIVAYKLLVGDVPFKGSIDQVERWHREGEVDLDIAEIPVPLRRVLGRCLEKDPRDRFEDINAFEAALCEAQIAMQRTTAWDHLPLPDVDPERRDRIAAAMPDPRLNRIRRRIRAWASVIAVAAVLLLGVGAWALWPRPDLTAQTEAIIAAANRAAAAGSYIYPLAEAPAEPTAYQHLVDLEALAPDEAAELRRTYGTALADMGERLWDRPGGQRFAIDFYVQAQVFLPDDPTIRERATLSPGALAAFTDRAESGSFEPKELRAAEPLRVLAANDGDPTELEALIESDTLPEGTAAEVRALLDKPRARTRKPAAAPTAEATIDVPVPDAPAPAVEEPPTPPEPTTAEPDLTQAPVNRETARSLAKSGHAALARLELGKAETLFHRALDADPRSAAAAYGLSVVYFERDQLSRSIKYGEKAVRRSARRSSYRLHLGDAYFRAHRYADARRQYTKAQDLGHTQASARLKKLDKRLGG